MERFGEDVHEYNPSRSQEGLAAFLKGFKGYLQTDGYPGYNLVSSTGDVIQVGCFAHARCKFYDICGVTTARDGRVGISSNGIFGQATLVCLQLSRWHRL